VKGNSIQRGPENEEEKGDGERERR